MLALRFLVVSSTLMGLSEAIFRIRMVKRGGSLLDCYT